MERGDKFNVKGYDIVATAQAATGGGPPSTGEFVVMHNNSSHYIIASREPGSDEAFFEASFRYATNNGDGDEQLVAGVYMTALDFMVALAKRH